jgi:hypothetical protein
VDGVRYRDVACAQHLLVKLLLLQLGQLSVQCRIVNLLANRIRGDRVDDFVAERILFADFIPAWHVSFIAA